MKSISQKRLKELHRIIKNTEAALVKEECPKPNIKVEGSETEPEEHNVTSTAGKKAAALLDKTAMNAFKTALETASSKDAVKETLGLVFNELSEKGQGYLKAALKELAADL